MQAVLNLKGLYKLIKIEAVLCTLALDILALHATKLLLVPRPSAKVHVFPRVVGLFEKSAIEMIAAKI